MSVKFKLCVVESKWSDGIYRRRVLKWKYQITTGSRCNGLMSYKDYDTYARAELAGKRMLKRLQG